MLSEVARVTLCLALLVGWGNTQDCPVDNNCPYENVALLRTTNTNDQDHYYIGGLFGVHQMGDSAYQCSDIIRNRGLINVEAFLWSIDYLNAKLTDRSISIGGVAFDNCGRQEQTIENVLSFSQCKLRPEGVKLRNVMAYVGPDRSSEAMAIGRIMTDLNMTYVSHAATSPDLADAQMFPYFLRTTPSDANDAVIMARMLNIIGTKYAVLVYVDNSYGRAGMMKFKEEASRTGVCAVTSIRIPNNPSPEQVTEAVDQLAQFETTKYVALYADAGHARRFLEAVNQHGRLANRMIFVGTSSWGKSNSVIEGLALTVNNSISMAPILEGPYDLYYREFVTYWTSLTPLNRTLTNVNNEWFNQYWEQKFECSLLPTAPVATRCDLTKDKLTEADIDVYVPYVIMAVDAIINGVQAAARETCNQYRMCSGLMNIFNRGTKINEHIREVRQYGNLVFTGKNAEDVYTTGDVSNEFSRYEILNIVDGKYRRIATFNPADSSIDQQVRLDSARYPGGVCPNFPCTECNETLPTRQTASPRPPTMAPMVTTTDPTDGGRRTMVYYPINQEITGAYANQNRTMEEFMTRFEIGQKWIIALGVLAGLGIFAVIVFEIYVMYKLLGSHNSHKWRTVWLGQLLLFGIFLSYLTLFAYIPIPTKASCGITRFGVGVSYAIMFAVLLVKLMVILTSRASESLLPGDVESPNYLKGIYQFLMFMFAVGVQVVIAIQWLITVPPEAIKVMDNRGEPYWICNHYTWSAGAGWENMMGFIRTEFENHVLSLIYIMVLILITTILALKSHGIITNNRESIFIGISAGFSIPIWLAWTLVGGLNRDQDYAQEFGDACMAFGLFLTATLILFAMFLPKVRQLVNMGVEGIYFEDDRDTVYNESVILPPPSYKSRPGSGSIIYVNHQPGGVYADPVVISNGDPSSNHLKYGTGGSVYSSPPGLYRKAESTIGPSSRVLRVTGDLTGKYPADRKRAMSDYGYGRRSEKGTLTRSRSQQNIGAL